MNDIKHIISQNILLEAKIEDQKAEIAELRRLLKRNRAMLNRQLKINENLSHTFEKLDNLGIPEVEELLLLA